MRLKASKLLLLFLALTAASALARAAGTEASIYLEADRVEIDQPQHLSRYTGHVVLQQGGLTIKADTLVVYRDGDTLQRVEASGKPVTIEQAAEGDHPAVRGKAEQMRYLPAEGKVTLEGQAHVWQGNDEFSGERINYDARQQHVIAEGEGGENGRVQMIIRPDTGNSKK